MTHMLTQSDLTKIKSLLEETAAFKKPASGQKEFVPIRKELKNIKMDLKKMGEEVVDLITAFDKGLKIEIETAKTELRDELKGDIRSLDNKIESVKTELKGDMRSLDGKIESVKTELKDEITSVRTELNEKMDTMVEQMSEIQKNTEAIPSLREKIDDHEIRIKKLEIKNPLAI